MVEHAHVIKWPNAKIFFFKNGIPDSNEVKNEFHLNGNGHSNALGHQHAGFSNFQYSFKTSQIIKVNYIRIKDKY